MPTESISTREMPSEVPPVSRLAATVRAIDECAALADTPEGISLGDAADRLGSASFCFVSLLLAMPFLQPISLGPLTMASGGVFLAIGWQMARGREHLALPERARAWHLRGKGWISILKLCRRLVTGLAKLTRPRLTRWVDGRSGSQNIGWLIFIGGALLAMPCANLPFNNTLPALMIVFATIAWLERDGLFALLAIGWGLLTVAYFAATVWLLFWAGSGIVSWWKG